MKNKKKLIKRIGAVLCALVVAVSSFGVSNVYYGAVDNKNDVLNLLIENPNMYISYSPNFSYSLDSSLLDKYPYYVVLRNDSGDKMRVIYSDSVPYFEVDFLSGEGFLKLLGISGENYYTSDGVSWEKYSNISGYNVLTSIKSSSSYTRYSTLYESNFDIYCGETLLFKANDVSYPSYNASLGYLQNVSRKSTYIRGALYNYDEDSLTYHWYHDLTSSSGVDLTSGVYKIRHYISKATVKGYEKEDIVEMSDKYLMADYDASQGYFSYLDKDYEESIRNQGYEDIDWVDKYLRGYFVLEHNYFQIVNTATNEVGGYLHFYPKDATGDSFGVELEYEGLDNENNVVEDAPSGYIDTQTGSGTTVDDALENANEPKLDDLSGVEEFISVVKAYGVEVENVSNGVGALLGQFPPWVLGVLGLSFSLMFIGIIICVMKG